MAMLIKIFLSFVLAAAFSLAAVGQQNKESEKVLDLCDVAKKSQDYVDKSFTMKALFVPGYHDSILKSDSCDEALDIEFANGFLSGSCGDKNTERVLKTYEDSVEYAALGLVLKGALKKNDNSPGGFVDIYDHRFQVSCVMEAFLMPREQNGCRRIDETMPFQYISFLRRETGAMPEYGTGKFSDKKDEIVLLKLVNNSACPISIPVDAAYDQKPAEGDKIPLIFGLTGTYRSRSTSLGGDTLLITGKPKKLITLSKGMSVSFGVPAESLKERYNSSLIFLKETYNISLMYGLGITGNADRELYLRNDKIR